MLKSIIDRPITVTMAMLVAVVLGAVALRLLPVSLIPDVDIPYITVQASNLSLAAREMDERVVKPLRQQLIQINGLEELVTESRDGSGTLKLTFGYGADIDYLFIEANEKIDRCMSDLPDIDRPKVLKASATDIPAFFIDVTMASGSDRGGSFMDLSRFSREVISKRIEQLAEVAMVDVSGLVEEQILVLPDAQKHRTTLRLMPTAASMYPTSSAPATSRWSTSHASSRQKDSYRPTNKCATTSRAMWA